MSLVAFFGHTKIWFTGRDSGAVLNLWRACIELFVCLFVASWASVELAYPVRVMTSGLSREEKAEFSPKSFAYTFPSSSRSKRGWSMRSRTSSPSCEEQEEH